MDARVNDSSENLHTRLSEQTFSCKITRTCVPLMVARLSLHWDAASQRVNVYPIVQSMVVLHEIGGIQSHDEFEELRRARPAAEFSIHQQNQETNNRGAKAFRDKARELTMNFFIDKGEDEKLVWVKEQAFGVTGSTLFEARGPDHPVIMACRETAPPVVHGETAHAGARRPGEEGGGWGGHV